MSYKPFSNNRRRKSYAGPGEYLDDIAPVEYMTVVTDAGEGQWLSIFPSVPGRETFDSWIKGDSPVNLGDMR